MDAIDQHESTIIQYTPRATLRVHDLCDDELLCVFEFLPIESLLLASQACTRWSCLSTSETIWQLRVKTLHRRIQKSRRQNFLKNNYEDDVYQKDWQIGNFSSRIETQKPTKQYYVSLLQLVNNEKDILEQEHRTKRSQTRAAYLSLCGLHVILFGLLYVLILSPLLLDQVLKLDTIIMVLFFIFPIFAFVPPYLFVCLSCVINLVKWIPRRRQYRKYLREFYLIDRGMSNGRFHLGIIHVIASWFAFIPINFVSFEVCFWVSTTDVASYSLACIPMYVFTVAYVAIPPLRAFVKKLPRGHYFSTFTFMYIVGCAVNILLSLQVALLGAKLDRLLPNATWQHVFTPFYIIVGGVLASLLGSMFAFVISLIRDPQQRLIHSKYGILTSVFSFVSVSLLLITPTIALVAVFLDGKRLFSTVLAFIPTWIMILLLMCVATVAIMREKWCSRRLSPLTWSK